MTYRNTGWPGQGQKLSLDRPATYQITIQGRLGADWSDWFEGMTMTTLTDSSGTVTMLTGQVHDQAALHGLLNKLYGLGLPLLTIDCLEVGPANDV
ncbi:MAG: hypothetical protein BroJett011_16130 [Chloroflexota bacterium]|nr:MAG: hypothetical protein BroJett011_16130 [Chloroflexota bacterium]